MRRFREKCCRVSGVLFEEGFDIDRRFRSVANLDGDSAEEAAHFLVVVVVP